MAQRIELTETQLWVMGVCCALLAGAALSLTPRFVALALLLVGVTVVLSDATSRLAVVVLGGVLAFGSSAGVGQLKTAYLSLLVVAILAAAWQLRREPEVAPGDHQAEQTVALIATAVLAVVAISLVVAYLNGHDLRLWFRDVAPYAFGGCAPLLGLDAARHVPKHRIVVVFTAAGLAASLSFMVTLLSLRAASGLAADRLLLPSFLLPAALFAYSCAQVIRATGGVRWGWGALGAIVLVGLVSTGTRTTLILLAIPLALTVAVRGGFLRAAALFVLWGLIAVVLFQSGGPLAGITTENLRDRLLSTPALVTSASRDQSLVERKRETADAMAAFRSSPIFGVGPGHIFEWTAVSGLVKRNFVLDSAASVLAKLGLVGAMVLLGSALALARLFLSRTSRQGDPVAQAALSAFGLVCLLQLGAGVPFEDKGFAIGLVCLSALSFSSDATERRSAVVP